MTDSRRWLVLAGSLMLVWLVLALQPILMPFLIAAIIAYVVNPVVVRLVRLGLPRSGAVALAFVTVMVVVILGVAIITPLLWRQALFLESKLPGLLRWTNIRGLPWLEQRLHVHMARLDLAAITSMVSGYWVEAGNAAKDILPRMARSGLAMAGYAGLAALVPVVTFYLLLDWEQLLDSMLRLVPSRLQPRVRQLAIECDDVLAAFFRGQLLVMLILGIIYALGLELVGLNLGLMIGMLAGLGSIIPYFGFTLGIISATVVALFQYGPDFHQLAWVGSVFLVGQIAEGWILQPFLLGDRIGLPPVAVIFAVLAGGTLFGFFGMLVALPMAAVIMVILRHAHREYLASAFYRDWPSSARSLPPPSEVHEQE